ncbi:hypothetical protein KIN20_031754 [Parelaphostrongylus tenuis]|uniref:Uncharacterized protein n=1 Tax=Parelaphostrongylus tenuis TaxID=148309 RepID=A0AAD5WHH7_PARTN|nr:hypothetical protein KIN20_031754 [Parelaphostrongylus tenuis]
MRDEVEYPPNCLPIHSSCGTNDLVKRLKILSEALQVADTNEECDQPYRFRTLLCHLANPCFLNNGNRDVQIWLACCLADILRVSAPVVPLDDLSQLKNVLMLIVRTLRGLDSPSNPLFRRYFYLVQNLSVVNTLELALELPHDEANDVIRTLLKIAMEVANGKEWRNDNRETSDDGGTGDEGEERSEVRDKVIRFLIETITKLLRGVDQVSVDVLDVLFFYLINPQKLNNRESYKMARHIIQVIQTSLEAAIQSLLTQSLLSGGLPPECELVGSGLKKLHDVILELHEISTELVSPTLPHLSSSLRAEDNQQRLLATRLVGKLAASEKSRLYDDHSDLWKVYMDRFKDTSPEIREACAKDSHEILLRHSQLRGQISLALGRLTRDLDDSVRLTAVLCIIETAKKKLEAVNESLILACCDRMKDKKPKIRQEVVAKLLNLYSKVITGDEYTPSEIAAVTVIPKKAFALYMLDSVVEEKSLIERYFSVYIVPYKMGIEKRIKSMVDLFCKLDKFESQVFAEIVARSSCHRRILREMLDIISRQGENGEEQKAQLQSKIQRISSTYHDSNACSIALEHFTNLLSTEQKCFGCGVYLVSNVYTTTRIEETCKELVRRSTEVGTIPKDCQTNIRRYIERVAPLIMDQDSAEELLRLLVRVKSDAECGNTEAITKLPRMLRLVKIWGEYFPHIFARNDCIEKLLIIVASDDPKIVEPGLQVLHHITLQSTLKVKEQDWSDVVLREVWSLISCQNTGFGRCCKLAVRIVCRLLTKEECTARFNQIFTDVEERVSMDDPGACVNALQVISEFHRSLPQEFSSLVKSLITKIIVPGIILSPESDDDVAELRDPLTPLEERPVSQYCLPKVYGMKLFTRYLFTCSSDVENDALAIKAVKMFVAFIQAEGDLHDSDKRISVTEKAWLRAVAGVSLLKLCYVQKYSQMIDGEMFATLAKLMTDEDCVRIYFVKRLNKGIMRNRLTIEYFSFFSLVNLLIAEGAQDGAVKNYRDLCRGFLLSAITRRQNLIQSSAFSTAYLPYHQPEYTIAYSVWLLSHQPLLASHSDLISMATLQECLWFMMEPFMTKKEATDFEFMYHLLQYIKASSDALYEKKYQAKEITDAQLTAQNKKMWALADLGMLMLVYRAKVIIRNEPRKPLISTRFFVRSESAEQHSGAVVYAPHELIEDEKQRNGKIPTNDRRRFFNVQSNTSIAKKGDTKNTTATRKTVAKGQDHKSDISSTKNISDSTSARKGRNRRPLKVEQENRTEYKEMEEKELLHPAIGSPAVSGPTARSSLKRRKTRDDSLDSEGNRSSDDNDDDFPPSTSGGQLLTSGSRSHPTKATPNTKSLTPLKRSPNKQSLQRINEDEASVSFSSKDIGKSSKKGPPSYIDKFPDFVDFSPIVRSGFKSNCCLFGSDDTIEDLASSLPHSCSISSRRKSRNIPLSTSTPMHPISTSSKVKARGRKVTKRAASSTVDDREEPKRRKKSMWSKYVGVHKNVTHQAHRRPFLDRQQHEK